MTPVLALTACIAMALVVFRAATQAITIDEAATYVLFVEQGSPLHWLGSTNNHVLNTALMRVTTRVFGLSELTARLPALLGAALYISACYRFCRKLDGGALLKWSALVCLVYSPFVMDYLVAARGYSLALGFLMAALVIDPSTIRGAVWISTAIGLCFASNFSFALVCAAVLGGQVLRSWGTISTGRLVAAYLLPALTVTWLLSAPSVLNFPRAELWYGAHSLRESFASLLEPQLVRRSAWIYALPGLLSVAWLVQIRKRLPPMTLLLGGTFLAATLLHFAAFHLLGLLYPLDRTGLFFVPLLFGALAAAACVPGGRLRWAQIAALTFAALLNLASLRIHYFEEWHFDEDTNRIFAVLDCLHTRHQVDHVASTWPYMGPLNFYRSAAGHATIAEVIDEPKANAATEAFVFDSLWTPTVERDLTTVWRSRVTDVRIAVPSSRSHFEGSECLAQP